MKQLAIFIFFLHISLASFAQTFRLKIPDAAKGFQEIKLGTKKENIKNLLPNDRNGFELDEDNYEWFSVESTNITFKGIKLKQVICGFYTGKVFQIEAALDSADRTPLIKTLRKLYGSERPRYSSGFATYKYSNGVKIESLTSRYSHDEWLSRKISVSLYPRNYIKIKLRNAEKIKRKSYREQEKQESKKEWKAEDAGWIRRGLKKEFRKQDKAQRKEDKEFIEYLEYQRKQW